MMDNNFAIIMAGGVGSRFWPLSKTDTPKQFLDILNTGKTLIEQTFDRLRVVCPAENIFIVSNRIYQQQIEELLPQLPKKNILSEPMRKNTAPCIAYGMSYIKNRNPQANVLVVPSDHVILKEKVFEDIIKYGFDFAQNNNVLLTIGIKPHKPETGYGYIKTADKLNRTENCELYKVDSFKEKPNLKVAKQFLAEGNYFWNSGMFIWSANSIWHAFEKFLPETHRLFEDNKSLLNSPDLSFDKLSAIYQQCKSISIDYGIMEKADNVHVICADIGWSDIGTWGSVHEHLNKDEMDNAKIPQKILFYESKDCMIKLNSDKVAVIQGLEDYIVVENNNLLLICEKQQEQRIKQFVEDVKKNFGKDYV